MHSVRHRNIRSRKHIRRGSRRGSKKTHGGAMSSPTHFAHHFMQALHRVSEPTEQPVGSRKRTGGGGVRQPVRTLNDRSSDAEDFFDTVKSNNTKERLKSKLFPTDEFPFDHAIIVANDHHLPPHINTLPDYQKWLSIEDQLSSEGRNASMCCDKWRTCCSRKKKLIRLSRLWLPQPTHPRCMSRPTQVSIRSTMHTASQMHHPNPKTRLRKIRMSAKLRNTRRHNPKATV